MSEADVLKISLSGTANLDTQGSTFIKADMENVVGVRHEGGRTKNYTPNLKKVLNGEPNEVF
jgi:hypothetical protein